MPTYNETATDTGLTQTETLLLDFSPVITDTGLTQTDSPALITARGIADTLTFSDYIGAFARRPISDTGLTQTDSFHRVIRRTRTDTGSTITDQFIVKSFRLIADTGATITDSNGYFVTPAPDSPFAFLCSRKWLLADDARKGNVDAYARFTYTTVGD